METETMIKELAEQVGKLKKQKPKMHYGVELNHHGYSDVDVLYLCNHVVFARNSQLTFNWNKVTCKNCLRKKPKKPGGRDSR